MARICGLTNSLQSAAVAMYASPFQMNMPDIDLRSDTVTKPTPAMRRAMAEAEVGDDVYGDDPTDKRLEAKTAELLGKEAALFVPSGTMANQIAVGVHTHPGDELLCSTTSHVYVWEAGGIARLWGVTPRTFAGDGGLLTLDHLRNAIRPGDDAHYVRTRLVCLENTHNRGGGRIHPITSIAEIARWAREHNLAMHLDGARLMNAVVGSGILAHEWARYFDTVSICFSKGLGAPIGSAVAGSSDAINDAWRLRKLLGGGMRQVGVIAAAALYALENHVHRLSEDHANAQILANAFASTEGFALESGPVETNLVWVTVNPSMGTAADVAAYMRSHGIIVSVPEPQTIRVCTHLDITTDQVKHAARLIREIEPAMITAMTLVY
jgi:threonine aldolase